MGCTVISKGWEQLKSIINTVLHRKNIQIIQVQPQYISNSPVLPKQSLTLKVSNSISIISLEKSSYCLPQWKQPPGSVRSFCTSSFKPRNRLCESSLSHIYREALRVDLNCKYNHFPLPDCRCRPGLHPRSSEGTSPAPHILLLFLDFMIKPSQSCFSSVVAESWHSGCAGVSGPRLTPANGSFFHPCLTDSAHSNTSLLRKQGMKKRTVVSPTAHRWGHCPRPPSSDLLMGKPPWEDSRGGTLKIT